MRGCHRRSFTWLAALAIGALAAGAACAQTAPPAPKAKAPVARMQKKAAASVVVAITNSRSVALSELDATPAGLFIPKAIVRNVAPGKKVSATVPTNEDCVYDLHGIYADGSTTDSTSVDICKDQNVNLVD